MFSNLELMSKGQRTDVKGELHCLQGCSGKLTGGENV